MKSLAMHFMFLFSTDEVGTRPIAMPLPSNDVVADALSPFDRANPADGDLCRSKYWRDAGPDKVLLHIETTQYWMDLKDDTMFHEIAWTGEVVSIENCKTAVHVRQQPQSEEFTRLDMRQAPPRREAAECASSLQELERALAAAKAKQAEMMERLEKRRRQSGQTKTSREVSPSRKEPASRNEMSSPPAATEDVLASLGVSGSAKAANNSGHHYANQRSPPNGMLSGDGSNGTPSGGKKYDIPPPPPHSQDRQSTTEWGRSQSAGAEQHMYGTNQATNQAGDNGCNPSHPEARQSTYRRTSDYANARKRVYEEESSSDESDTPRRQEDDVTPKNKRRQPKVAAAYR